MRIISSGHETEKTQLAFCANKIANKPCMVLPKRKKKA